MRYEELLDCIKRTIEAYVREERENLYRSKFNMDKTWKIKRFPHVKKKRDKEYYYIDCYNEKNKPTSFYIPKDSIDVIGYVENQVREYKEQLIEKFLRDVKYKLHFDDEKKSKQKNMQEKEQNQEQKPNNISNKNFEKEV